MDLVKQWLLVVGLVLAAIMAFVTVPYSGQIMIVLGLVLGWFCVSDSNATTFLIAVLGLLGAGLAVNSLLVVGEHIGNIIGNFATFLGGAAFLVALRSLYNSARG